MNLAPLMLLRDRCVVLFSGGWDSTYCLELAARRKEEGITPLFFDCGQPYAEQEREAVLDITNYVQMRSRLVCVDIKPGLAMQPNGCFPARNRILLSLAAVGRPRCIYFGSRNVLPIFDRYKDSNWWFARQMSRALEVPILTPCVAMSKEKIIRTLDDGILAGFIYSTEPGYRRHE